MSQITEDDFLQEIVADPANAFTTWGVLADFLDDRADQRSELVRLLHQPEYLRDLSPEQRDARVRELLTSGMQPVVPVVENSIGMKFAHLPDGAFWMGSPDGKGSDDEHPRHQVEITRPFFLGVFPVTQEQYQRVVGKNPSWFYVTGGGESEVNSLYTTQWFPVESVSWDDAVAFCELLSNLPEEKKAGRMYRLPTEAEWEYACRGGATSHSPFHCGATLSPKQANFHDTRLGRPCPVGSYPANAFGLCDMHGNVWEWCSDWYDENYYQSCPERDPQGPGTGNARVLRGGSWNRDAWYCRSAYRYWIEAGNRNLNCGARVCFRLDYKEAADG